MDGEFSIDGREKKKKRMGMGLRKVSLSPLFSSLLETRERSARVNTQTHTQKRAVGRNWAGSRVSLGVGSELLTILFLPRLLRSLIG